jgi:hypothetical protein
VEKDEVTITVHINQSGADMQLAKHLPEMLKRADRELWRRARADQWRPIADARERQERAPFSTEELERYGWRDGRQVHRRLRPLDYLVIALTVVTLLVLYVLSCGLNPNGGCWK